jgi:hypothetical protein
VLAELHGGHGHERMHVIRRGDDHRVDILLLLEHHAEVLVLRGRLREFVRRRALAYARLLRGDALVDVAERDDVVGLHRVLQVVAAHPVRVADDGDVDGVARRLEPGAKDMTRHDRDSRSGGCRAHEGPPRHAGCCLVVVAHRLFSWCATRSRQMYTRSTVARAKSYQRSFDPGLSCQAGSTSS